MESVIYNDIFIDRLNQYNLLELIEKIKLEKGVFFGSFVISTIINEYYPESDIDIVIPEINIPFLNNEPYSNLDIFIINELGGVFSNSHNYDNSFSYKYILPNITLNIIRVDCDPEKYIKSNSDLDICTSTFDGKITKFVASVLKKEAMVINYTEDFNLAVQSFSNLNNIYVPKFKNNAYGKLLSKGKSLLRMFKYEKRNFKIFNLPEQYIYNKQLIEKMSIISDKINGISHNKDMFGIFDRLIDILKGNKKLRFFGSPIIKSKNYNKQNENINIYNSPYSVVWFYFFGNNITELIDIRNQYGFF